MRDPPTPVHVVVPALDEADHSVQPLVDNSKMLRDLARIRWIHRGTRV